MAALASALAGDVPGNTCKWTTFRPQEGGDAQPVPARWLADVFGARALPGSPVGDIVARQKFRMPVRVRHVALRDCEA